MQIRRVVFLQYKYKELCYTNLCDGNPPVMDHAWGQRVVRFYDPDYHIIEVGENMKAVCKRFSGEGMTLEGISERMRNETD